MTPLNSWRVYSVWFRSLVFIIAVVTFDELLSSAATITTVAGGGFVVSPFTDSMATNVSLPGVEGLAPDLLGNLNLAHTSGSTVHRLNLTNGLLTTVAGTGNFGYGGDNGPAVEADLAMPQSLAVDLTGNLYISDPNSGSLGIGAVRKMDVTTGIITSPYDADSGTVFPYGIAVDVHGNLYISDVVHNQIFKQTPTNASLQAIAGHSLASGHSGDGGPATNALINAATKLAVDASDNVYFIDQGNRVYIRRIDGVNGIITTIAGGGDGDGASGSATNASLDINANGFTAIAEDLAVDNLGSLYIGGWSQIWKVDLASGNISIIAGAGGTTVGFSGDGGPATNALLNGVLGLAVSGTGDIYFTDGGNDRVRRIMPDTVSPFQVLVDLTVSQSCLPVQTPVRSNLYLAVVNGRLALVLPNGTNVPGDVIVTNSTSLSAITVPAPAKVGGNLSISAGTNSTSWDLSQLTGVNGSLSFDASGPANFTAGNIQVNGSLTATSGGGGAISIGSPDVTGDLTAISGGSGNISIGSPDVTGGLVATSSGTGTVSLGSPNVAGNLSVTNSNGTTAIQSPTVKGSGTFTFGGPGSSTASGGTFESGLAITGSGSGKITVGDLNVTNELTITGSGSGTIDVGNPVVSGDLVITSNGGGSVAVGSPVVSGELKVTANGGGSVSVGSPDVSGDMTVTVNGGSGAVDISGAKVSGNTTLVVGDATTVAASTADGNTSVTLSNGPALMQAVLPTGTFTSNVVFTVTSPATGSLTNVGTGTNGTSLSVSPVAAYRFAFAVPTLNQDASLTFDITLAALAPATQSNFLAALAAGLATVAVLGDAPGSTWQTFPICESGQVPGADGCVSLVKLDATGTPLPPDSTNAPAVVRFVGVAGHFSTWAVVLVQPAAPPVHLATSLLGDGKLRLSWTGPATGVLETSTNLAPNSWSPAGAPTQQPDGSWRLEVSPTQPARFYRFRSQ